MQTAGLVHSDRQGWFIQTDRECWFMQTDRQTGLVQTDRQRAGDRQTAGPYRQTDSWFMQTDRQLVHADSWVGSSRQTERC